MLGGAVFSLVGTLLVVALPPQCYPPQLRGDPASRLVVQHIGAEATSCGRLWCHPEHAITPSDDQIAELQACMARAYRAGRSFYFSIEEDGADSYFATGLMRRGSGPLQRFWLDSQTCPGRKCPASLFVADCPAPEAPDRIDPFVVCATGGTPSRTER